jgi:dolichol-phosphate mannosyltransferase
MEAMRARIVIPTFDERETIGSLILALRRWLPPDTGLLIVDDGSPDGTGQLVRDLMRTDARLALIERTGKQGLGTAYQAAFRHVLAEGGDDCIVTMDADFSHDPAAVPALIAAAADHDLVVGSRYITGGATSNWHPGRRLLSVGGNHYARLITRTPIRDLTSGFSCMRTDFLARVPFEDVRARGYAWWIALRTLFHRRGARIAEVPITFVERRLGRSKMSSKIVYEGLIEPWRISRRRSDGSPRG